MSEYWKSTPKYWCKFCKTYVRDTKFEKEKHEATGRHQGNIQRSLRTLHKEHEREDRDKQRAKDEVARLNGVVSGKPSSSTAAPTPASWKKPGISSSAPPKQATEEQRKQQLAQLASMGIAIPQEYRGDMALAGEWQTVAEKRIGATPGDEEDSKHDVKNIGVRKRRHEGDEEAEEAGETVVRRGWGSTFKSYPGAQAEADDIEALMSTGISKPKPEVPLGDGTAVKKEDDEDVKEILETNPAVAANSAPDAKEAPPADAAPVVFKKRKAKAAKVG